jgi:hypothetical protein
VTLQRKSVYVNDRLVGEASSWAEVHTLIRTRGLAFISEPAAAEGPLAFYISSRPSLQRSSMRPNRAKADVPITIKSAQAPAQERRRYPRKGSFWRARLQTPAGDFECLVMNLSPRGAHIQTDRPLSLNQSVTLILEPLGEFSGTVVWCYNNRVGIQISEHRTTGTKITRTLPAPLAPMLRELKEALEWTDPPRT